MRILSFNVTHDSSVCVLNDGKIEFFCKEERLSRVKRDKNPFKSLELYSSLNMGEIDHFVYGSPSNHQSEVRGFFHKYIEKKFKPCNFSEFGHHLSHAMLAFTNSGFDQALVFVIDRDGSVVVMDGNPIARESESVYVFDREQKFKEIHKSFWLYKETFNRQTVFDYIQSLHSNTRISVHNPYSIVKVYEAATTLIGQDPLENGKTMGLSSYGEDIQYDPLFYGDVPLAHMLTTLETNQVCFFNEKHLITKDLHIENYKHYANRAKQVQLETQEQVCKLIDSIISLTGVKNVCLVGGYALNVVANNFYLKQFPDVNFYFEPVADDTGVSIGSAMLKHWIETDSMPCGVEDNFYHYYDASEKINAGKKCKIDKLVDLLCSGKSLAIFEGNPEAGPRALGHRSILFDARNENAKEIVNRIKKREWYRPFAGVVLESEFENYFEVLGMTSSPYMTINFDAKDLTKDLVPGIIHVDGTCRAQTVNKGFLFDLLTLFNKKTKCPMLLNTSFNLAGEPLVQTKADAIKTFENSELDAIYFVDEERLLLK
jgi:carbamoyltransferase